MMAVQLFVNGIGLGVLYALMTIGFALVLWTTKILHVAHGATYLVAGYTYVAIFDASVVGAVAAAAIVATTFGLATNELIYRPMARHSSAPQTVLVASLGVLIIVENLVGMVAGSEVKTLTSSISHPVEIGSIQLPRASIVGLLLGAVMLGALVLLLRRTSAGVGLRGMADDGDLMGQIGLATRRYANLAFLLGSLLVVPAAILTTHLQGLRPSSGLTIGILAFVAAIAGGAESLTGACLGAVLFGVVQSLSTGVVDAVWEDSIAYGFLLIVLVLKPRGLIAARERTA